MPPAKASFELPYKERTWNQEDEFTVIAIDPGGTTGWAKMSMDRNVLLDSKADLSARNIDWTKGQVDCGSRRGELQDNGISTGEFLGVQDITRLLRENPTAAVVIEDFTLRQFRQDRDLLSPVRITAAIGYSLWLDGREYFTQTPADAKRVCTDTALRQWGLYDGDNMVHARDATRHAVLMLRKIKSNKKLRERLFG